jgi:uncharacterized YccA/Bax inhibitor family protein
MDLSNPWSLVSGLFIGCLGMALFMFGKKQTNPKCMLAGAVLCVFPYFVSSVLVMWAITAACMGGLYATRDGA